MTWDHSQETQSILIIDGEPAFRTSLTSGFAVLCQTVLKAATYAEGLALAREQRPSVVILEYRFPDGSGIDLIRLLKHETPGMKFAMVSSYASVAVAVQAMRVGATTWLSKPVTPAEILHAIRDSLPDHQISAPETPSLAWVEWEHIHRVLNDCQGNISEAARRLRIHRQSLQRMLRKHPPRS